MVSSSLGSPRGSDDAAIIFEIESNVVAARDVRVEPEQIHVPFVSPVGMTLVRHVMAGPGPAIYRRTVLE